MLATEGVGRSTPSGWVLWSETPNSLLIHVGKTATLTFAKVVSYVSLLNWIRRIRSCGYGMVMDVYWVIFHRNGKH